jgi:hypothetical protein
MTLSMLCGGALLCGAALTVTPAIAGTWTGAYNATIVSTYSDGRVVKVYVNPDHTYSIALPDGGKLKGTWKDADGQSCFTVTDPPPKPDAKPTCFPLKDYRVGDTFSGEDASGAFTGRIVAGR